MERLSGASSPLVEFPGPQGSMDTLALSSRAQLLRPPSELDMPLGRPRAWLGVTVDIDTFGSCALSRWWCEERLCDVWWPP